MAQRIAHYDFETEQQATEFYNYAKERMATMTLPMWEWMKWRINLIVPETLVADADFKEILQLVFNHLYIDFYTKEALAAQKEVIDDFNS